MREAGVKIAALFSPEHGFLGTEDREGLADAVDPATGIKVYSLYGKTRRPTPEMLAGLDALVFDIQDVGVRFYTYETTMAYALEAAAKAGIPYFVLDRPNPITGVYVEGPMIDKENFSFVGYFPLPLRHGMTMGELAQMFNEQNGSARQAQRGADAGLAARRLVGLHAPALGEPLAQHAQPQRGAALPRRGHARVFEELFGGARNGRAVRAGGGGIHPRRGAGGVSQQAHDPRRTHLPHPPAPRIIQPGGEDH